jgi:phosphotransferase system HPr (HPr) family protein
MYKVEVQLKNETGLHARPASVFTNEASKYKSNIILIKDGNEFDAKSIISILCMGAFKDDRITIAADGEDEREAVESLRGLIEGGFEE